MADSGRWRPPPPAKSRPQPCSSHPVAESLKMASNELEKLELLSLVNSITQELVNHTGLSGKFPCSRFIARSGTDTGQAKTDSTLAEFLIHIHGESKDYASFKQKCAEVGADFPGFAPYTVAVFRSI